MFGSYSVTSTIAIVLPSPGTVPSLVKTLPGDAGIVSGVWTIVGGGAGISTSGRKDWFRFVSSALNGNDSITVRVNSSDGSQAGLVIRDLISVSDNFAGAGARYAGIWRTATGLQWATRETAIGAAASRAQVSTAATPVWLRLTRSGASSDVFTAFYSSDGNTWTQLGSPRTFTMSIPALVGLAVASGSASSTATATFSNLGIASSNSSPTIATPAAATPSPFAGTSTALSVLGADDAGESAIIYTWSASGPAPERRRFLNGVDRNCWRWAG